MNSKSLHVVLISVAFLVVAEHFRSVVSHSLHGAANTGSEADYESIDPSRMFRKMMGGLRTMSQEAASRLFSGFGQNQSHRGVYDMVKNGSELGINVMSGLVKFDRVREPGRPRAMSVRVFGIPVFNKGFRQGDVLPTDRRSGSRDEVDVVPGGRGEGGSGGTNDGSGVGEEEELPLD